MQILYIQLIAILFVTSCAATTYTPLNGACSGGSYKTFCKIGDGRSAACKSQYSGTLQSDNKAGDSGGNCKQYCTDQSTCKGYTYGNDGKYGSFCWIFVGTCNDSGNGTPSNKKMTSTTTLAAGTTYYTPLNGACSGGSYKTFCKIGDGRSAACKSQYSGTLQSDNTAGDNGANCKQYCTDQSTCQGYNYNADGIYGYFCWIFTGSCNDSGKGIPSNKKQVTPKTTTTPAATSVTTPATTSADTTPANDKCYQIYDTYQCAGNDECYYKKYVSSNNNVQVTEEDKKCIDGTVKYDKKVVSAESNASWCRNKGYDGTAVTKNVREETVPVKSGKKLCYFKVMKSQEILECIDGASVDNIIIDGTISCLGQIKKDLGFDVCLGKCKKTTTSPTVALLFSAGYQVSMMFLIGGLVILYQ